MNRKLFDLEPVLFIMDYTMYIDHGVCQVQKIVWFRTCSVDHGVFHVRKSFYFRTGSVDHGISCTKTVNFITSSADNVVRHVQKL